ncbi:LarC family nickel insertion protein [Geosporobacter ferrireducens]|uniref:LarC family nickel insertion protein n=1 Tax=Geosporobacter ferrireducens TaxID=1424294 RepID=UPI00139BE65B|nr:LarC family nickel insertion protein [Geosporobacter ferrireducens]MTI58096.1 LarC family nickel insertion protein [Geosporobacter ferrireducens]
MSKKTLYLECYSGISGDMTVAALLDLGADKEVLLKGLESLPVDGFEIKMGRVSKRGIDAFNFDVILKDGHHHHHHEKEQDHEHHHSYEHRNIEDIFNIIDAGDLTEEAKKLSGKIFNIAARAEAKAHGIEVEKVHFHEVGAIDSIVDIIATAICLDNLEIEEVIVSELFEGNGYVKCQHGLMPVPVPAVVNILQESKLTVRLTENRGEMITPTGAAIAAAIVTTRNLPESYTIEKVGIGAGKKDFKNANILRAYLIERTPKNSFHRV